MWFRLRRTQNIQRFSKFLLFFILLFAAEEYFYTFFYKSWKNYYNNAVTKSIEVQRVPEKQLSIGVLVVIDKRQNLKNYEIAQDTVKCYCQKFKYKFLRIEMDKNPDLRKKCPQKDFMFQRHCVTIHVLQQNPDLSYLLFLDADMGIINPNHLIEDYINPKYDLTFYERIFNFEVMAGSYIVKNTPYSCQFLKDWVDYEKKLPNSFHGTDNAAIHQILVDWYNPNDKRDKKCREIWEESKDWDDVWKFTACSRSLLNGTLTFDRIRILPKSPYNSWARDGWLTNSEWSPKDFIFHGWQKKRYQKVSMFAGWFSPLTDDDKFDMKLCSTHKAHLNWQFKDTFMENDDEIERRITNVAKTIRRQYEKMVKEIWA